MYLNILSTVKMVGRQKGQRHCCHRDGKMVKYLTRMHSSRRGCLPEGCTPPVKKHRSDSIQGTDYIANDFFLNFRVSRSKFENLK